MALLQDGFRALSRNLPVVLLAMLLIFLASLAYFGAQVLVAREVAPPKAPAAVAAPKPAGGEAASSASGTYISNSDSVSTAELSTSAPPALPTDLPNWVRVFNTLSEACFAAAAAAIYAIVLSLLGRAIDRPIWKCGVPGEALGRYFVPWFILTLGPMVMRDFQVQLSSLEAYELVESVLLFLGLFLIPVGACIMFYGALVWHELGQTLGVISRQFRLLIPVLLVGLLQYILQDMASHGLSGLAQERSLHFALAAAFLTAALSVFDLLAFAMVWRVCMLDRDTAHHSLDELIDD